MVGFIILAVGLNSCTGKKKEELRQEVMRLTTEINAGLAQTRQATEALDAKFEELFASTPLEDVSVEGMDVSEGDRFAFFDNTFYYKMNKEKADIPLMIAFGARPVDDITRKKMRLVETLSSAVKQSANSTPYIERMSFFAKTYNFTISYPFYDIISVVPPKFDYEPTFWFQWTLQEKNPERKTLWIPEPFIAIGPEGWLLSVYSPVYHRETVEGVIATDVSIYQRTNDLLHDNPHALLLVSGETLVIGSTPSCKPLKIKTIKQYDYLEQLRKNPETSEEFKLSHESQPADLQRLARKIKQQTEFTITMYENEYFVTVGRLEEVELYMIGLLEL